MAGAVKVTPAHDQTDFKIGKSCNLKTLQVIRQDGTITSGYGKFSKLPRFVARKAVLDELGQLGLLRGDSPHKMSVPFCSRSNDVVELLVRPQWFLRCHEMAEKAVEDVKGGSLTIAPRQFEKTWFQWLDNIRLLKNRRPDLTFIRNY